MSSKSSSRRPRRQFSDEYKASVVRLVLDERKTVGAVARELDLTETAVRAWVAQARGNLDQSARFPHSHKPVPLEERTEKNEELTDAMNLSTESDQAQI